MGGRRPPTKKKLFQQADVGLGTALAVIAVGELNASVVVFDDFAHDGQAEACAVGFGRVVRREEFGLLFVGQAGAVVDNGDARHGLFVLGLWTIFELDGDVRVELGIFGGLDTMSDDIDEYAPHEFGVDIDLKILVILGGILEIDVCFFKELGVL